jgi:hypothetical protein
MSAKMLRGMKFLAQFANEKYDHASTCFSRIGFDQEQAAGKG